MSPVVSRIDLTPEQRVELSPYFGTEGWWLITQAELPGFVPPSLRPKIDSALVITAPTSTGGTYYVLSTLRLDRKERAFDNDPFGAILHITGPSTEGFLVHHGDWPGRTEAIPPGLWDELTRDGIGDYFFAIAPPGKRQGSLEELMVPHSGAFRETVAVIRTKVDGAEGDPV